jgi:hypothetical protein
MDSELRVTRLSVRDRDVWFLSLNMLSVVQDLVVAVHVTSQYAYSWSSNPGTPGR